MELFTFLVLHEVFREQVIEGVTQEKVFALKYNKLVSLLLLVVFRVVDRGVMNNATQKKGDIFMRHPLLLIILKLLCAMFYTNTTFTFSKPSKLLFF